VFPLCAACAEASDTHARCTHTDEERMLRGTWTHLELRKAVEKGYVIKRIHEVKAESSGWPKGMDHDAFLQLYEAREGIRLDPARVAKNPGLRATAKLFLNSLWGRFGMRPNQDHRVVVQDCDIMSPSMVRVTYRMGEYVALDEGLNTNVYIALYTSSQARLMLDSKAHPVPLDTGDMLGQLKIEEDNIIEFAASAPKSYAFHSSRVDAASRQIGRRRCARDDRDPWAELCAHKRPRR